MNHTENEEGAARRFPARFSYWGLGILLLAILFSAAIRIRLLEFPLERDEGEYAYAGQLILQGIPPYKLACNMKLPGVYFAYAGLMAVFGQTIAGIHIGLIVVNIAAIVLVFLLARRLVDNWAAAVACAAYTLLSVSASVLGMAAHATHFVVLPMLAGCLLLLRSRDDRGVARIFWSGVLFGVAFLMKQPGLVFVAFGASYLLWMESRARVVPSQVSIRRIVVFLAASALPFLLACFFLWQAGVFEKFWFWVFSYASQYATQNSLSKGWELFSVNIGRVVAPSASLWLLAALGCATLIWNRRSIRNVPFIVLFTIFSCLAVCPGFYFRRHYFILLLPALSLLAGLAVSGLREIVIRLGCPRVANACAVLLAFAACGYPLFSQQSFFFKWSPTEACRRVFQRNPFPESIAIANYIREHTSRDARIAVVGSEPEIYFYSQRHSATGHIYTYGLMEEQDYALKMQLEMIHDIESVNPEYVVFVNVPTSWLVTPGSQRLIFEWFNRYAMDNLEVEGIVDIVSLEKTEYRWGSTAAGYKPQSNFVITILKRKTRSS